MPLPQIVSRDEWAKARTELLEYNVRPIDVTGEKPGLSCFLRVDDRIFHTYSQYVRGADGRAARTPSWTSPPWDDRRTGRSRTAAPTPSGTPHRVSSADLHQF
ncbi:DUF899 family protein [Pseudonocardia xishanensis]|uniref:Uncharacterized protein n=1 Tax=Pseudonocardia xishanensis TaxID=630995 RepID=A0ABP8S549_9PSEU